MVDLLDYADEKGFRCYFLGATAEVSEKMVATVSKNFPDIVIAGSHHGFFDLDDPAIVEDVAKSKADLIFVALGLPRQEQWIAKHIDRFEKGLFMGVGGSFDTLTGTIPRAPQFWINLNLEWLYRLLKQPFRWKRILKVFEFMARVLFRRE
ncbi:WecB/TagA/CpsF family glycosyltransferase [Virgibacillus sp. 179-BFC.A HS]|uniref:WecB/TagA/CpsF family glycosyltransferase n=1 Tax=Tigheibacillus jepli TaxID=3035914 RepID=A0ABU5CEK1_9BACI|nr:WecB/TagA/CpsF family glycosyltransferase [Virgibacillus sp. 179-BFC.A HS]MDY0404743.1 WecB/TagA/CpsF family glycosyltransferase [Virgibacillus sp. 179-BFC.A HS]